jgi:hypothetical protein
MDSAISGRARSMIGVTISSTLRSIAASEIPTCTWRRVPSWAVIADA